MLCFAYLLGRESTLSVNILMWSIIFLFFFIYFRGVTTRRYLLESVNVFGNLSKIGFWSKLQMTSTKNIKPGVKTAILDFHNFVLAMLKIPIKSIFPYIL